ncbi:MAG: YhjD/YihY/BrkB family envelope integrity protein [Ktedonobacteraceae bacterium]
MESIPDLPSNQSLDSTTLVDGVRQRDAQIRRDVAIALWLIGLIALLVVAVIVRFHPAPWPFDLQTTITVQHLQLPSWVITPIVWASLVDNPIPSAISLFSWFVVLLLIGMVVWRRGGSPIPWFVTAIFLSFGTAVMAGLDGIVGFIAARPRPASPLMHVYMPEPGIASFPSGHVENDVVYYGFLLYLSLSKPVSQWRYRWFLIPFQLYATLNILLIGYSRVYEGSHWLTDASGGYLTGALWLVLLIVLYRWTLDRLTQWYARRSALTRQEPQLFTDTVHGKSLETVHVVEKKLKPSEQLLLKCKEDWIVHLAQALAFSFLMTLVSLAYILLPIYSAILGTMNTQMQLLFTVRLENLFPSPLSTQVAQVFSKALDIFSHASPLAKLGTLLLAVLLGSNLFSLMEACFDVIYHLPPRPFLRRHIVALGMLGLFVVLEPLIILAAIAPTLILSLAHVLPPGNIPESNSLYLFASIVGSTILALILFQAIYVLVPSRHINLRTIGLHIRNSWRGALIATGVLQLSFLLFHIYASSSLSYYIGDLGFILIMLIYFYLFTLILLFGAEINAFFAEGILVPQNDLITQASRDDYR